VGPASPNSTLKGREQEREAAAWLLADLQTWAGRFNPDDRTSRQAAPAKDGDWLSAGATRCFGHVSASGLKAWWSSATRLAVGASAAYRTSIDRQK
jgi:hypothetical protein